MGGSVSRPHLSCQQLDIAAAMSPNVTIRNISSCPLELILVEHFDPDEQKGVYMQGVSKGFVNITNSIGLTNTTTRAPVPVLSPDAQPFEKQVVKIRIEPFTVISTDINPRLRRPNERLRLTFQVDGGARHQMYCPVPTTETHTLSAIGDDPRRFTGLFFPSTSYVALYLSSDAHQWMSKLADRTRLGALSIPGTHNSPTCYNAPPSVRCQAVSPADQLANGVRFFDIRVQVPEPFDANSDKLVLVHSLFPISFTGSKYFRHLVNGVYRFLDENRSETLIMSLKREGPGKGTDQQLSLILKKHYSDLDRWFTEPRVPVLGEARGRVVLIRRFHLDDSLMGEWNGAGWGIDGSSWADNTPNATCPSGDLVVQDFYEVLEIPSIEQKIRYACDHLERSGCRTLSPDAIYARGGPKTPLYINFLSGSNFWKLGTWPEKIAAKVNPSITEYLCQCHMLDNQGQTKKGDWSTGVVVCDWVGLDGDWDLVRCVVGMNTRLEH